MFSMFVIDLGFEKLSHPVAKKVHQNNNSANNSNNSAKTGINNSANTRTDSAKKFCDS